MDSRIYCHLNWTSLMRAVHDPTDPCTVLREVSIAINASDAARKIDIILANLYSVQLQ
jgi:hypothetical protein